MQINIKLSGRPNDIPSALHLSRMFHISDLLSGEGEKLNMLEKLRELNAKRTEGPWVADYWAGQCHMNHMHSRNVCKYDYYLANNDISPQYISINDPNRPYAVVVTTSEYGAMNKADSAFIAALANSASALLDVVAAAQAVLECSIVDAEDIGRKLGEALARLEGGNETKTKLAIQNIDL